MKENIQYQAYEWESDKPIDLLAGESQRRYFQKLQMKNDGMTGYGDWVIFKPVDPVTEVIDVLRNRLGLEVHELTEDEI